MMGNPQPIYILQEGTSRSKGRDALSSNIQAARAIADAVRTTLGPRGMDKMLVDNLGDVVVTNDGATILKELDVSHPAAKMLIEVAKTQEQEAGDGTTTSVVLAGALLHEAEKLVDDVHPTILVRGFGLAAAKAQAILQATAFSLNVRSDKDVRSIAATSMYSKSATTDRESLADLAVRAVRAVAEERDGKVVADLDQIQIVKKHGGGVEDTQLVEGLIVDKERVHENMPSAVRDARIAILETALEIKKPEIEAHIEITDPERLREFLDQEEATLRAKVDKVVAAGANVVFCQKGIDDLAQHFLAKQGVYAVRRVKKSDMEKLARAAGGRIVGHLDDLEGSDLGRASLVEERKVGEDAMTFVTGCRNPKSVSILVRGGTEHVADELERTLDDALSVTADVLEDDGRALAGGGAPEIELALQLRKYAAGVGGREQLAIRAFADALEVIPHTLAQNAGLDPIQVLVDLRAAHEKGQATAGINVFTGKVVDMRKEAVLEPLRVKSQAIAAATEVASMILRIDDTIAAKAGPGGGKGKMPGAGGEDFGGD
ncbi:MAG TPA: thermosome subunit beta [Candidatus Thermoplasmatota archaeon]|nr:thermosome subunit beta [Candidatus Thermoplasmatota archaeon]